MNTGVYIITGATGAIGTEVLRSLAIHDEKVIVGCRDMEKGNKICNEIIRETGNQHIFPELLSLDSFQSIRKFALSIGKRNLLVKGIINNAGIKCSQYTLTQDGFETTIGVNYLSQMLLTELLLPMVVPHANIVFTISVTRKIHKFQDIHLHETKEQFSQLGTYGRSKLALTAYAAYLHAKYGDNVQIKCADPGIVNSDMISMNKWYDPIANIFFRPFISSPKQGAKAILRALQSNKSGQIFTRHRTFPIDTPIIPESLLTASYRIVGLNTKNL